MAILEILDIPLTSLTEDELIWLAEETRLFVQKNQYQASDVKATPVLFQGTLLVQFHVHCTKFQPAGFLQSLTKLFSGEWVYVTTTAGDIKARPIIYVHI